MSEQFPWLCSTVSQYKSGCEGKNNVSENEAANAEEVTTDAYGTYGLKFVYYKVSQNLERDKLFGEDQLQIIERAFNIIGYCDTIPPNVRTYQLQGIWGEDLLKVYVGRSAFRYWSTYGGTDRNTPKQYEDIMPRIGDIVYLEPNDTFYEIREVQHFTEAFGLTPHTYTLTLKVYKDIKMTIDTANPTLSDRSDPIYKYAPDELLSQYEINDPLKVNDILSTEGLKNSKNSNHMNILFNDEKESNLKVDPFDGWR